MYSPTNKPTRRKFLERSALGAGSLLFAPLLLDSCTDHRIPPSDTPIIRPLLGDDYEIDWYDAAKSAVVLGIGMIPEVGEILGPLTAVFWPEDKPSVWDQVKAQVEELVDQKIGDFEYGLVTQDLEGLKNLLTLYQEELNDGSSVEKLIVWLNVRSAFATAQPHFQAAGYELPLLGLFGQFANLYLSILRDVVISGKDWGRTDADHAQDQANLTKFIQDFTTYTTNTYNNGRQSLAAKTPFDYKNVEPFRTVNAFDRQMAFLVLDFRDAWQYFDIDFDGNGTPIGANVLLTREIYTDPVGQGDGDHSDYPFTIPTPGATQFPTQVDVWSNDKYYDAIQMTYPQGSGPGGVTQTRKWGAQNDGVHRPLNPKPDNPLITAIVSYGSFLNTIQFIYADLSRSPVLGVDSGSQTITLGYYNEAISSAYIQGAVYTNDRYAGSVIVFGFRYWKSPAATLSAIGTLYVKTPKERSAADLAKAFPKLGIPANLITDELKAARKKYWASIKEHAEKIKNKPK